MTKSGAFLSQGLPIGECRFIGIFQFQFLILPDVSGPFFQGDIAGFLPVGIVFFPDNV
mgnify:CR=1 FL=1